MPYMISGIFLDFQDPQSKDIRLSDIAHNLGMICRFNGSCPRHYSVAEHSVIMSYLVDETLQPAALLHDSHEAYTGDLISPLKELMKDGVFQALCGDIDYAIGRRLEVDPARFKNFEIKMWDEWMLDSEIRAFFPGKTLNKRGYLPPDNNDIRILQSKIKFLTSSEAKTNFLRRARELDIRDG